ncbi:hypothetical protein ckrop_0074 [Corynebacterium kroppenstedtii DSM 44385]|uniref:Uncharacterized protein n=1 Tax=Corynebacterium kroppenstedtii (strain DSM 44385 / JCM 11950 / CIP 105744 / CCUG 35717) TaxID=645127 RepID=C4LG35_CORK4|nr:hypothetical protein ckrop_0074 [Corynebacterium kroppenstedtii DSM 44385]
MPESSVDNKKVGRKDRGDNAQQSLSWAVAAGA